MGGVGGAFVQHADQVAASFAAEHQLLLRVIMTRLVTPEGTRAVVEVRELRTLSTDAHEVDHVLDQLVRARLVHVHTDAEQVATAELVHEVLITAWPTLRRWLEATQAFRAFHQELGQAARGWAARNKPDELLWHGAIAQEALGHAERRSFQLNEIEREFVAAIGARDARRRRRKLGALIAAFAVLGAVIAGGTFALVKIRHAEHDAREGQVQSERARAAAEAAGAKLKAQNDLLAEKERQRQAAEQEAKTATADTQLTREQLAEANKSLELQVAESQASEQRARKAQADAEAARAALERKAAAERAELEKLKAQAHDIVDGDLIKKRGKR
jgi:hypothetical protein